MPMMCRRSRAWQACCLLTCSNRVSLSRYINLRCHAVPRSQIPLPYSPFQITVGIWLGRNHKGTH